jgi:hypothetical protein
VTNKALTRHHLRKRRIRTEEPYRGAKDLGYSSVPCGTLYIPLCVLLALWFSCLPVLRDCEPNP